MVGFDKLVPISQPKLFAHKFPSQKVRFSNLVLSGDVHAWFGDKDDPDVLFAVEKLRGAVSLFAEAEAPAATALSRLTRNKEGTRHMQVFPSTEKRFTSLVIDTLEALGLTVQKSIDEGWRVRGSHELFQAVVLDPSSAAAATINEHTDAGVTPLTVDDVPVLLANWKYASADSGIYVTHLIETLPTACVRSATGELEAWVLVHADWSIGMLNTLEAHRRKGHGRRLVRVIAREVMKKGFVPFANAADDNVPSLSLFESLGFTKDLSQLCWIVASK